MEAGGGGFEGSQRTKRMMAPTALLLRLFCFSGATAAPSEALVAAAGGERSMRIW